MRELGLRGAGRSKTPRTTWAPMGSPTGGPGGPPVGGDSPLQRLTGNHVVGAAYGGPLVEAPQCDSSAARAQAFGGGGNGLDRGRGWVLGGASGGHRHVQCLGGVRKRHL